MSEMTIEEKKVVRSRAFESMKAVERHDAYESALAKLSFDDRNEIEKMIQRIIEAVKASGGRKEFSRYMAIELLVQIGFYYIFPETGMMIVKGVRK